MKRGILLICALGAALVVASGVAWAASSVTFTPVTGSPFTVPADSTNSPANPYATTTADFNGTGGPDLAVTDSNNKNVSVLLNKGDGTGSLSLGTAKKFTVGSFPDAITSADFDGKNGPDLAVANFTSGDVSVLLNDGAGSFLAAKSFAAATQLTGITSADFDGKTGPDLAVTSQDKNTVSVLLNDGTGSLGTAQNSAVGGILPVAITSALFLGAGAPPGLAVANFTSGDVSVLVGDGNGGFSPATGSPYAAGTNPFSITSADFDGHGQLDLAVANSGSNNVSVLMANPFQTSTTDPLFGGATNFAVGTTPKGITSADFGGPLSQSNGSGLADLAVTNNDPSKTSSTVSVLLNNSDGLSNAPPTFGAATGSPYAVGTKPIGITSADFDGTGPPDLAVANNGSANVSVLKATTVLPNSAPTAKDDPATVGDSKYSVDQDGVLTVSAANGVLYNDTDPDGDTLQAVKVSSPSNGTLALSTDGSFTYTPSAGYSGTDSFTYKANDGSLDSSVATVTLTVNKASVLDNTPPVVASTIPANNATGISTTAPITATFKEDGSGIDSTTISPSTFKLALVKPSGNVPVTAGSVTFEPKTNTATFKLPSGKTLNGGAVYQATITTGVKDKAGNALAKNYTWKFTAAGSAGKK